MFVCCTAALEINLTVQVDVSNLNALCKTKQRTDCLFVKTAVCNLSTLSPLALGLSQSLSWTIAVAQALSSTGTMSKRKLAGKAHGPSKSSRADHPWVNLVMDGIKCFDRNMWHRKG